MSPAKQPAEPTTEDKRAARIAAGPQRGVEWAESAFVPGQRFQYVVIDTELTPWGEHDNVPPAVRTVRGFANEEPYAF